MEPDISPTQRPFYKRTRYLIDARLQLGVALPLLAIPLVVAAASGLALLLMPGDAVLDTLTAEETRTIFFRANLVYSVIAAAGLGGLAVFLTHRIAGPAEVMERAVRGLQDGDYAQRLSLRPSDHLQSLAGALSEMRDQLRERDERLERLAAEIAGCLESGDQDTMRELLAELGARKAEAAATTAGARS